MGLEAATHISQLVATNPVGASDPKSQGDDHLRLIKGVLLTDFPNINAVVNATPAQLNLLVGLAALSGSGNLIASASPSFTGTPLVNSDAVLGGRSAYKAADTNRISTVALANDPDLVVGLVSGGVYEYHAQLIMQDAAAGFYGIKTAIVFSGTRDIHRASYMSSDTASFETVLDTTGTLETGIVFSPANALVDKPIHYRGLIRTTSAGNLQVQWAQGVNTASNTTLRQGSFFEVRRIA